MRRDAWYVTFLSCLLLPGLAFTGQTGPGASGISPPFGDISDLKLLRPEDGIDYPPSPPPAQATSLFNGTSLDGWMLWNEKGPARWKVLPHGVLQVWGGSIRTVRTDFPPRYRLHVEFRVPYMPKMSGQWRGNSGVFLHSRYEIQILDSYGKNPPQNNDCGAIYGIAAPKVNACKAPTVWQAFDIDFTAPTYAEGKRTSPARFTVKHNGMLIHDDVVIDDDRSRSDPARQPPTPGGLMLQDHAAQVQFRNLWLLPLSD
jgi:hypothetical protein